MRALNSLPNDELLQAIYSSNELSEKLTTWIQEDEMYWVNDKLNCFNGGIDYSIGFYNPNYFRVTDNDIFLDGAWRSIKNFGATSRLEKLYNQCERLKDTNLFDYKVKQLAELYFEEELQAIVNYVEDLLYQIHCKDIKLDYDLDSFADYKLDGIYINNEGKLLSIKKYN